MNRLTCYTLSAVFLSITLSLNAQEAADHEQLNLVKRQPDVSMKVTSVNLGHEESTITAEGDMGVYGRVYATYDLAREQDLQGGKEYVQGRGATDAGIMSGEATGYWDLADGVITMRFVALISDGTMNLDIVTFVPRTREMVHKVYVLK